MKKFITLLLSLCLALTCTALFVACEKKDPVDPLATAKTEATTYVENGWNDLTDLSIDLSSYTSRYEAVKSDITAATTEDQITAAKTTFDSLKSEIVAANEAANAAKELADAKTSAIASVEASWKALNDKGITLTSYETQYNQIKTAINAAETKEKVAEYKASFDALVAKINAEQTSETFIFEAEAASLDVTNTKWAIRLGGWEPNCGIFSGTGYLGGWGSTQDAIIFSIESDRAAKAVVGMRVGFRYDRMLIFGATDACFSGVLVNDSPIDLPEDAYFEAVTAEDGPNYFAWGNQDIFTIDLVKGTNTIRFDLAGKNINWDYLYLTTVAELSWTSEKEGHNYSDWVVTKMPTAEEEGRMFRQCDLCCNKEVVTLPVLSDAYTVEVTRQATQTLSQLTTYTVDGRSFVVETAPALGDVVAIKLEAESGKLETSWDASVSIKSDYNSGKSYMSFNSKKGTLTYTFNSAASGTATLVLNLAPHKSTSSYVGSVLKLKVNGKSVAIDDTVLAEKDGSAWFNAKDYTVATFEVKEGENTLVIEGTGQPGGNNLDYLLIKSAAFEEELVSLTVKTEPTKIRYVVGESFDATGMVVEAVYNTGRIETVTDYTVDKTVLAVEDTEVTVSYGGLSATVSVTVTEVVLTKYTFDYKNVAVAENASNPAKDEGKNWGNVQHQTFTITVNCAEATTVEFIFNGARTDADYKVSGCFATFTVNGEDKKSDIPDDSLKGVFKGWTTPVDFTVCNIDLQKGTNVITFKMAQNVNLFALSFLSSEVITVVSPDAAE